MGSEGEGCDHQREYDSYHTFFFVSNTIRTILFFCVKHLPHYSSSSWILLLFVTMPPKGGLRQRYERRQLVESESHVEQTTDPPRRGGIKQRRGVKRKSDDHGEYEMDSSERAQLEYRESVVKKYLENRESSVELKKHTRLSMLAGAGGVADLGRSALPGNSQRSLYRAINAECDSPPLYEVHDVPMHNPRNGLDDLKVTIPVLLPHEVVQAKIDNDPSLLTHASESRLPKGLAQHKRDWCAKFALNIAMVLCFGVFTDGVPSQTRKVVETITWNLLEVGDASLRYLFACVPKEYCCKCGCSGRHTLDPLFEVLAWSFKMMHVGLHPFRRHDGSPFGASDKERAKNANRPLSFWGGAFPSALRLDGIKTGILNAMLEQYANMLAMYGHPTWWGPSV